MALKELFADLAKSNKYTKQLRFDGLEPFIKTYAPEFSKNNLTNISIKNGLLNIANGASETLVRGGIITATQRRAIDAARISSFLTSPRGIQFVLGQQQLQLINWDGQFDTPPKEIYNPLNTLAQITEMPQGLTGNRGFKRTGFLERGGKGLDDEKGYYKITYNNNFINQENIQTKTITNPAWLEYINKATNVTNSNLGFIDSAVNVTDLLNEPEPNKTIEIATNLGFNNRLLKLWSDRERGLVSEYPKDLETNKTIDSRPNHKDKIYDLGDPTTLLSTELPKTELPNTSLNNYESKLYVIHDRYDKTKILSSSIYSGYSNIPNGFRREERTGGPDYSTSYLLSANTIRRIDKLNYKDITTDESFTNNKDLIKFRFSDISNEENGQTNYLYFRANVTNISDGYKPEWDSYSYVGRGEKFYTYKGFDRTFSFNFTVFAMSSKEMRPIWRKLNYLASNTAPDYSINGRIRGPLMRLTIGDYLHNQPGFIESLTFTINDNYPWDVGVIGETFDDLAIEEEKGRTSELEMPMGVDVQVSYKIIPDYLPQRALPGNGNRFIKLKDYNNLNDWWSDNENTFNLSPTIEESLTRREAEIIQNSTDYNSITYPENIKNPVLGPILDLNPPLLAPATIENIQKINRPIFRDFQDTIENNIGSQFA